MAEGDYKVKAIVSADTTQFNDGMKKAQSSLSNISKSIQGVQNLLKSAFSVVGITASVGAVANFGKKAVTAADEANKRFNILSNTIKATGASTWTSVEELDKMAKAYAQSTNYSASEVEKMQSVLLGFRNITGETFEQASDAIMDMATVMGMDLTSAVQTVGKALDDPVKGLDSLRRQGFQFTEEQKAELQQLVKNGKQLEAQQIILNELATTYGGAAKAGQSAFARLQHTMDEFRENIGNKLMPVVETVMSKLSENMSRITSIINSSDFDNFVAIIINVGNKIKSSLDKISQSVKDTFDNIKSTVGSVDFSPFMKLMDTLVAVVQKIFGEIKQTIQSSFETFAELKERMGIFTDALDLDKIVNIINTVIDVFMFLRDEIQKIGDEIRTLIFDNIVKIWDYIKQIFNNSNKALEENEKGFASWGDFIWEQVNNVFRIFQDLVGMVTNLLKGNWQAAWEYAKLSVMRVADTILNLISQIANAFPNLINGMVNSLNTLIEGANKIRKWMKLDEWDLLKPFESVDLSESSGLNAKIEETEKKIAELTGKQADYAIDEIKRVSKAASGFTQNLIEEITDTTDIVVSNANQRSAAEVSSYQTTGTEAKNTYKKISDWDLKLLNQQLNGLKEYSEKYHNVSLQIIEAERQKALEADTTGAETYKINTYYNKQIELENKRYSKSRVAQALKVTGEVFKVVADMAKKVVSTISGIFNGVKNIMLKLFDFNIDDALDNLLVFEDKVLTFFVETLPKLPQFFASVIQSVEVLFANLANVINSSEIANIITAIIESTAKNLPNILDSFVNLIMKVVDGIAAALIKNKDKILNSIRNLLKATLRLIKEVIPELLQFIVEFLPELLKLIVEFTPELLLAVKDVIIAIARALPDLIPAILEALPEIISAVVEFIISDLPYIIYEIIRGLILGFAKVNWLKVAKDCFSGFINGFKKLFGIHSPSKLFEGFGKNIVQGLLNGLKGLGDMLLNVFKTAFNGIQSFFGNIENWFSNAFSSLTDFVENGWNNLVDNTKNLGEKLGDGLSTAWTKVKDGVTTAVEKTKEVATNIGTAISKGASTAWEKTKEVATSVGTAVADAAKKAGNTLADGVKKIGKWLGFATGTQSAPKGLALVGEAGPELVRFNGGEQVLNTRNTQKALASAGGNTNNFNVVFNNLQDTSAYAMMSQLKAYNRQMAINGII